MDNSVTTGIVDRVLTKKESFTGIRNDVQEQICRLEIDVVYLQEKMDHEKDQGLKNQLMLKLNDQKEKLKMKNGIVKLIDGKIKEESK